MSADRLRRFGGPCAMPNMGRLDEGSRVIAKLRTITTKILPSEQTMP